MSGRLVVVPTPIGNLGDITVRALDVLRAVDLVVAEDTRHTRKLLNHYGISVPLRSYHQHNKRDRVPEILEVLQKADVALLSSAGMPSIADPGFELVDGAMRAGFDVDVLPGPSALTTAVVAAAIPGPGFAFLGFLPRKRGDRRRRLEEYSRLPLSLVLYEAPHRLRSTLEDVHFALGDRMIAVARELTKLHQELLRGRVSEMINRYTAEEPRGEFTLVIQGRTEPEDRTTEARDQLRRLRAAGEDRRKVISELATSFGVSRNTLYRWWHEE